MTATAPTPTRHADDGVTFLHVNQLRESPTNPRRVFDPSALDDLAESIRGIGILEPLVVRFVPSQTSGGVTVGEHHEIVCGARRFRAAKKASLLEVPCFVRTLTDAQVIEAQYIENIQRVDLHPLDEGIGYTTLHEKHGHSVDDIARKLRMSPGYVYGRMQLGKLPVDVQTLYFEGAFELSHAQLLTRIPRPELVVKAAKDIVRGDGTTKPMPYRAAVEYVRRTYQCDLATAPFPIGSETLVPEAKACAACPKRTGNQRGLFGQPADADESADVCTDPKCFAAKTRAFFDVQKADVAARGGVVIEGKPAKDALHDRDYVDPDAHDQSDEKKRTWKQLVKGHKLTPVLIQGRDGEALLRWRRADVDAALVENGHREKPAARPKSPTPAAAKRDEERRRADAAVVSKVEMRRLAAVSAIAANLDTRAAWRLIVRDIAHSYATTTVGQRRGLDLTSVARYARGRRLFAEFASHETRDAIEAMTVEELQGLACELICSAEPSLADELGVDEKSIVREAKAELQAQQKAAAAAAKAKAAETKPPKRETTKAKGETTKAKGKPKKKGARA